MIERDKYEAKVKAALKQALKIIDEITGPDTHANAKIVAATDLVPLLLELDLDDE